MWLLPMEDIVMVHPNGEFERDHSHSMEITALALGTLCFQEKRRDSPIYMESLRIASDC
jgi:hypothetical protein